MGLLYCQAKYLAEVCQKYNVRGSIITFGRLDFFFSFEEFEHLMVDCGLAEKTGKGIHFFNEKSNKLVKKVINEDNHINRNFTNKRLIDTPIVSDMLVYAALGFHTVDTIDISHRYGQVSVMFDLNEPDIKRVVKQEYDLVLDAGVMEHVFDVRQMFLHFSDLMKVGGYAMHIMPGNNAFDHGFYQFCPTLFKDYYTANKFDIKNISVLALKRDMYALPNATFVKKWDSFRFWDYDSAEFSRNSFGQLNSDIYHSCAFVRKTADSTRGKTPTQYLFQNPRPPYPGPWA